MKKKTLTVQLIGFQIVGMTALALWGGGEGTIPMEPVRLNQESYPTPEQIREAINDNGFGVECMEGALVRIDELYTNGAREYGETQFMNISHYSDKHVLDVLTWGHEQSPVSVWELDDEILRRNGLL